MKICPNKNIEILTTLTKDEVIEKFKQNIEYKDRLRITDIRRKSFRDYEGYIDNDKVTFRRILKFGANSFIPQISGYISETRNETSIHLNARLHKVIEGFIIGFNSILLFLFVIGILNFDSSSGLGFYILFLIGLIFTFVFANGMTRILFNYELYRLEKDFRKILKSSDKSPGNDNRLNRIIEDSNMIF